MPSSGRGGLILSWLLPVLAGVTLICGWEEAWRWGMVGALFAWAGVVFLVWRSGVAFSIGYVMGLGMLLRLILFPLPPVLSDDVYRYLWDGTLSTEGINPFAHQPSDSELERFRDLEIYGLLNSRDYYSIYPPSSQTVFAAGSLLGGNGMWVGIYSIKGVLALFELAAFGLLARLLTLRKLLLYAWCPVVVLECWGQAHTETIAVFGIVLCLWAYRAGFGGWSGAALAVAGWAKLYPLLLIPFLWRRLGWKVPAVAAAVTVVLWLPFLKGFSPWNFKESLDLYIRSFEFNAGPYYALKGASTLLLRAVGVIGPETETSKVVGPLLRFVFLAGFFWLLWCDRKWRLPFELVAALVIMLLLVTMTTVHPWYVTPLLALILFTNHLFWSWQWLSVAALGTYLFYSHAVYWPFVWLGWGGWLALTLWRDLPAGFAGYMRQRACEKRDLVLRILGQKNKHQTSLRGMRILDVGAGEGYLGEILEDEEGAGVTLADVVDMNRSRLPVTIVDEGRLPFPDGSFEIVLLVYVLHHCRDAERVVSEALRVSGENGHVVVIESVYDAPWNHRLLRWLDLLANRLRSGGVMKGQEEHLKFRAVEEWERMFREKGARVEAVVCEWHPVHRKAGFLLKDGGLRVEG